MTRNRSRRAAVLLGLTLLPAASLPLVGCSSTPDKPAATTSSPSQPGDEAWLRKSMQAEKTPKLILSFAAMAEEQNQLDQARMHYEEVLSLAGQTTGKWSRKKPVVSAAELQQAGLGIARLDSREGQDAAAVQRFESLLTTAPNDAAVLTAFGQHQLRRSRLGEAEGLLRRAVAANPKDRIAKLSLGTVLVRQGQFPEARSLFVAARGPADGTHAYARTLVQAGHRTLARRELEAVVRADPRNTAARKDLDALAQAMAAARPQNVRQVAHRRPPARPSASQPLRSPQPIQSPQRVVR